MGYSYQHERTGDTVKVEIRDTTYRSIYKNTFNIVDKNAIYNLLKALERFSGMSIYQLIQDKLKLGEWW